MKPENSTSNRRYHELDSLRGLAALSVFFSHAINMIALSGISAVILDKSVLHIFWDGTAAVVLFFILSGFVLAMPYVGDNQKSLDIIAFYIRRIFRIYPAYWAAIAFSIFAKTFLFQQGGLLGLSNFISQCWLWKNSMLTLPYLLKHFTMIWPKFDSGSIDPVIWSLIVEMKMSILFPFLIPLIKRVRSMLIAVLVTCVFVALHYYMKMEIFVYMPFFVFGGFLAHFRIRISELVRQIPKSILLLLGILALFLYTNRYSMTFLKLEYVVQNYIIGIGVGIILMLSISLPKLSSALKIGQIKFLGNISYSFYLLHFPVLLVCSAFIYARTHSVWISWIISLMMSILISYISYRTIECTFMNLGRSVAKSINYKSIVSAFQKLWTGSKSKKNLEV